MSVADALQVRARRVAPGQEARALAQFQAFLRVHPRLEVEPPVLGMVHPPARGGALRHVGVHVLVRAVVAHQHVGRGAVGGARARAQLIAALEDRAGGQVHQQARDQRSQIVPLRGPCTQPVARRLAGGGRLERRGPPGHGARARGAAQGNGLPARHPGLADHGHVGPGPLEQDPAQQLAPGNRQRAACGRRAPGLLGVLVVGPFIHLQGGPGAHAERLRHLADQDTVVPRRPQLRHAHPHRGWRPGSALEPDHRGSGRALGGREGERAAVLDHRGDAYQPRHQHQAPPCLVVPSECGCQGGKQLLGTRPTPAAPRRRSWRCRSTGSR